MRKIAWLFVFCLLFECSVLTAQGKGGFWYQVSVDLPANSPVKAFFIAYEIGGEKFIDTLSLKGKSRVWSRQIQQPVAAIIYTDLKSVFTESVFLANNRLSIREVGASQLVVQYKLREPFRLLTANDRIRPTYFPLYGELNEKKDSLGLMALSKIFDSLKNDDVGKAYAFFMKHPDDHLGFFSFTRYAAFANDYAAIEKAFALLPEWAKNSPDGVNIHAKISSAKSIQVGSQAPDFQQSTSSGGVLRLSDFKGKYVLIDFWASWCGPCRKQHPELIQVYDQFKGKNFEIISVSLDAAFDPWMKAIQKDKLVWPQVSDLKGQQNVIALKYGVQAIPANFLVDPDGKIIRKNLEPGDLASQLLTVVSSLQNH